MNADFAGLAHALLPEAALVLGALAILGVDLVFFRNRTGAFRLRAATFTGALAIVAAAGFALAGVWPAAGAGVAIMAAIRASAPASGAVGAVRMEGVGTVPGSPLVVSGALLARGGRILPLAGKAVPLVFAGSSPARRGDAAEGAPAPLPEGALALPPGAALSAA